MFKKKKKRKNAEDSVNPEKELTLLGHLGELRTRLLISVVFLIVATLAMFAFAKPLLGILIMPVVSTTSMQEDANVDDIDELAEPGTLLLEVAADGSIRINPDLMHGMEEISRVLLVLPAVDDGPATRTLLLEATQTNLRYDSIVDPFMMQIKVALILGILISLPIWIWQIWLFVSPGLTGKEKKVVGPMLLGAILLFPLGASFAFGMLFLIMRVMERYFVEGIAAFYSIGVYVKVMTNLMIVFGFIFELPLLIAMLARIGIVTPAFLRHYRRHIYVGLAFLSMMVTPADPFSMIAALIPLVGLFEISIQVAKIMEMTRKQSGDDDEAEAKNA